MLKNPIVKNILSAAAVAVFGFILLNITFLFDFVFQRSILGVIKIFTPVDLMTPPSRFPAIMHALFVVIIGLISWFILRSKLSVIYKAIYMTVPMAVVLVTIGISFYQWPVVPFLLGGLFTIGILYYFYHTKQPWLYHYSVILVSVTLAIMTLLHVEI